MARGPSEIETPAASVAASPAGSEDASGVVLVAQSGHGDKATDSGADRDSVAVIPDSPPLFESDTGSAVSATPVVRVRLATPPTQAGMRLADVESGSSQVNNNGGNDVAVNGDGEVVEHAAEPAGVNDDVVVIDDDEGDDDDGDGNDGDDNGGGGVGDKSEGQGGDLTNPVVLVDGDADEPIVDEGHIEPSAFLWWFQTCVCVLRGAARGAEIPEHNTITPSPFVSHPRFA